MRFARLNGGDDDRKSRCFERFRYGRNMQRKDLIIGDNRRLFGRGDRANNVADFSSKPGLTKMSYSRAPNVLATLRALLMAPIL